MARAPAFVDLVAEYSAMWDSMTVRREREAAVSASARRVVASRARYERVSAATGVPWPVIGVIHAMECGCHFGRHLHNGDPLSARTVQVPAGRPRRGRPPFTWECSASDALAYDGLDRVSAWTVERAAYELEKYNGFGPRGRGVPSAYLWSYSTHYARGKYVADGKWSGSAVSAQCGALPLLRAIFELCPDASLPRECGPKGGADTRAAPLAPAGPLAASRTLYGAAVVVVGQLVALADWALGALPEAAEAAGSARRSFDELSGLSGVHLPAVGAVCVFIGVAVIVARRVAASREGKKG